MKRGGEKERPKNRLLSTPVVTSFLLGLALAGLPAFQFCSSGGNNHKAPLPPHQECLIQSPAVFQDMADGDRKVVGVDAGQSQSLLVIKPYESEGENWEVRAVLDEKACNATVDFRVPGKPNPPPVTLLATVWTMDRPSEANEKKNAIVFTDPSGTLAPPNVPLNTWVQLNI